jgi:serine/threonine protein kinase
MSSNPLYNAQPRLRPGDPLREYRILRLVGVGGMGAVYEAEHEVLGARVAVKEILFHPNELDTNAYHRLEEAFLKEARLLIRLDHRQLPVQGAAIPRANNLFREGDYWYLVMEYMPGDTLGDRLEKNGRRPLPVEQVENWLHQMLITLDYLHHQEPPLIHRDIKPSNLKVNEAGRLVLLDFGIAKGGIGGSAVTSMFSPSVQFYTPHYSPPEQIRGKGTDARTDLFAVAATVYYLLAGNSPPTAETRSYAVIDAEPDPLPLLNTINPNVPERLARIIHSALSLKMEDRPQSAAAMRAMLVGEMDIPPPALPPIIATPAPVIEPDVEDSVPAVFPNVSSTDPIVTPISRPNPISRPTPQEDEPATETEAAQPMGDMWGAPVSVFDDAPASNKRAFPWAMVLVGVVGILLLGLVGFQLMRGGSGGDDNPNAPIIAGSNDPTATTAGNVIAVVETVTVTTMAAPITNNSTPTGEGSSSGSTTPNNGGIVATSTRLATSTPLELPTATATATETPPAATATTFTGATATPRPTNVVVVPSATPTTAIPPTATRVQFSSVALAAPQNGESFSQGNSITLSWQVQTLGTSDAYQVRIWKQSVPNVPEREFTTRSASVTLSDLNPEAYFWSVQIVGANGVVSGTTSETRTFFISGGGGPPDDGGDDGPVPNPTAPPPQ